jgi:hypothetical protein
MMMMMMTMMTVVVMVKVKVILRKKLMKEQTGFSWLNNIPNFQLRVYRR